MNLAWLFAQRYFVARKSTNAINIIAAVSVIGMMVGTMALLLVLSVFNGFEDLVTSLYNSFNPDLKVEARIGKTFEVDSSTIYKLEHLPGIKAVSEVLEENALMRYNDKDMVGRLKGVDDKFIDVSGIDSTIVGGKYMLTDADSLNYAVVGLGIQAMLGVNIANQFSNLQIYMPRREGKVSTTSPENAFKQQVIYPIGVYAIQQDFDAKYTIVPLQFMRNLLDYDTPQVSALEIALLPNANMATVQTTVEQLLGKNFKVSDRYQQDEFLYKVMRTEKWAVYLILTFILIIAAFNIVGSLSMLVIEKKHDLGILRAMGANSQFIRRVFMLEGILLGGVGGFMGMLLAFVICLAQQHFKLLRLAGDTFLIDAYPVSMRWFDFLMVGITVIVIALLAAYFPAQRATQQRELLQVE
ncbi:MAG: ABC transporter permease [Sphingobacteriales bacterium]|nr:ABC transporter permease [Sphingobacteriales bacterium]